MMRHFVQAGFCAVVFSLGFLAFAPNARADVQTIRSSNSSIWGSFGTSLFNYKEPAVAPDLPDSEHDWLPSLAAGAGYMGPNNLYLAIDGNVSFGDAAYKGAYFYYPTVPLNGTTHETIATFNGRVGKGFPLGNSFMLTPYAEFGFRYWERKLSADQTEDYQHLDALGGLMLQFSPTNRLIFTAYGAGGTTFSAQMKTDGDTYDLGRSGIYKIGGKAGFNLTPRVELFTTLDYDYFRYGHSGVVNGAYEPNSHTQELASRVGVSYHFR